MSNLHRSNRKPIVAILSVLAVVGIIVVAVALATRKPEGREGERLSAAGTVTDLPEDGTDFWVVWLHFDGANGSRRCAFRKGDLSVPPPGTHIRFTYENVTMKSGGIYPVVLSYTTD